MKEFSRVIQLKYISKLPLIGILAMLSCCMGCQNTSPQVPNIILINVDDMGWKDVGFMGSSYYETPRLDALAKKGMIFNQAYSAASNCAPSRACLMTGKWTPRHGIYTVQNSDRGKPKDRRLIPTTNTVTLDTQHQTLAQVLRTEGYHTLHSGKWHLSEDPLSYGFIHNIGGAHNGHPRSYYPPYKNVNLEAPPGTHLSDLIMDKSIEHLKEITQTGAGPFFFNYAPYLVHTPIQGIASLESKYKNKPTTRGQDNPAYASMIENLDRNIGNLVDFLIEQDCYENTIIVFTSDNGGLFGVTSQKPLRAGKGAYYEGGIRVPFFINWPKKIKPARRSEVPVSNIDIFPSLLALSNTTKSKVQLDGADISDLLLGNKVQLAERNLYWHFPIYLQAYKRNNPENRDTLFRTRPGSVIRQGDWKLHEYFEDGGLELYNLKDDLGEQNNLIDTYPEKTESLLKELQEWRNNTGAPVPKDLNPAFQEPSTQR